MKRQFIDYHLYLKSTDWLNKKNHWIKLFGDKCICGNKGVNLHHRHYKNLGTEPPHQLILLCNRCHMLVHQLPDNFTTDKRQLKLNLRKLMRLYRTQLPPTGMSTGRVLKTLNLRGGDQELKTHQTVIENGE